MPAKDNPHKGHCHCEDSKFHNEYRNYFIQIKKEEEKDDKYCRVVMEVKTRQVPDPINPFTKKTVFTQTYPTCLIPATPKKCQMCCP